VIRTDAVTFVERSIGRGAAISVPNGLWRLPIDKALRTTALPLHVNWSEPGRLFTLRDRRERALAYEIVLREGTAADLLDVIDGALLVDLWEDLVLPRRLQEAWQPTIDQFSSLGCSRAQEAFAQGL
jgi:hypothetical protein